jgi:hypothetical protein
VAPTTPDPVCNNGPADILQPSVTTGNTYEVPAGGAVITSWSTNAATGAGQMLKLKVFRLVYGTTYMVVGHDGPQSLNSGALNTFPASIAVQPGDVLGLNDVNAFSVNNACNFTVTGESQLSAGGDLADGASGTLNASTGYRLNASAVVGFKPSNNTFSFGKVKRNKHKGTATLPVTVPGPGKLSLTGEEVQSQRAEGEAAASKAVTAAGLVKLRVKAKRNAKFKLNRTGKVKVKVTVTYTPTGDTLGDSNTQSKRVKLVKKP